MSKLVRLLFVGIITGKLVHCIEPVKEEEQKKTPFAEKLTVDIDSVSNRIPPQIAYFIPDRFFNSSDFNNLFNTNSPPIVNLFPPNRTNTNRPNRPSRNNRNRNRNRRRRNRNRDRNNNNSDSDYNDDYSDSNSDSSDTDLFMSAQQPYRYLAVPNNQIQGFVDEDATTSYQNLDYQINFMKIPDKKPDFKKLESLMNERATPIVINKYKNDRPEATSGKVYNYANVTPNIRSKINLVKMNHKNKFKIDGNKYKISDNDSDDADEYKNDQMEQMNLFNDNIKMKRNRKKHKKPHYSVRYKLSQPTSSAEMESTYAYDNINADSNENYQYATSVEHIDHENCDDDNECGVFHSSSNQYNEYDTVKPKKKNRKQNGFAIFLTKVTKHPVPYRTQRIDKVNENNQNSHVAFIPTRILSSVRNVESIVHMPRKVKSPAIKSKLHETGGHIVYTEDGYEDNNFDRGTEDKTILYKLHSRLRRETNIKDLRGQELLDHLDNLIRNVSDYLNSSEIIPKTKYPLYNSTAPIHDSPIKYSEYARPIVSDRSPDKLYESKTKNCSDDIADDIDSSEVYNSTNGSKQRLTGLGNRLDCLKEKLFGEEPLDNPIFKEENISQPQEYDFLDKALAEADRIESISNVYTDVMDNIKQHSFHENQRIFSDFGITDNFADGTFNSNSAKTKPENYLNTSEKYEENYKQSFHSPKKQPLTQKPYNNFNQAAADSNPFNDPSQLPILDISKFIPTPKYTEYDFDLETDFIPIVSPYTSNYYQKSTETPITYPTTTIKNPTPYGAPKPIRTVYSNSYNPKNNVNNNPKYPNYNVNPNLLFYRRRRPIQLG